VSASEQALGFPPVRELVPHRGPMLLLDEVVASGPDFAACRVVIRPDSTFVEGGRVPGLVAVEYMAQTVAAYAGLKARGQGQPVRIGYLLGTRELSLEIDEFQVGDDLLIEVRHQFGDEIIGAFDCTVRCRGRIVASGCLNVYQGGREDIPA
jgi:predicted hotdog family 3-hydroxylacyl-ACP dehydratase